MTKTEAATIARWVVKPPYRSLAPAMSDETLRIHYEQHHLGYARTTYEFLGSSERRLSIEEIVETHSDRPWLLFNASQVQNHNEFWLSMSPEGGGKPPREIAKLVDRDFGGWQELRDEWIDAGTRIILGSGYIWLTLRGGLGLEVTLDGGRPRGDVLIACDVWEHAYYLDRLNDRARYLELFCDKLWNWDRVRETLERL